MSTEPFCQSVFVALASEKIEPLVAFYSALFGVQPAVQTSGYAEFNAPGLKLGIFQPKEENADTFLGGSAGAMSLCVEVTDLEGAIAQLRGLGYPSASPIMSASHGKEVYLHDPDRNRIILHQAA